MRPKVFIDGQEGTTGLQIYERLGGREDIELLRIDPEKRKDAQERKKLLNDADLVFLCLPDAAAREAVALIENDRTKVIDASTAHRTSPGWVYGFPELLPTYHLHAFTLNGGCVLFLFSMHFHNTSSAQLILVDGEIFLF